jgi:Xaa-Pro aminopeptidase
MNYETLYQLMKKQDLDGVFLSNRENPNSFINLKYATGFGGSFGFALITKEKRLFFTDFRYRMIAKEQVSSDFEIVELSKGNNTINEIINECEVKKLGFDKSISYAEYESFKTAFDCELVPMDGIFEQLRLEKTEDELKIMRRAAEISDLAFTHILTFIKPGVTEIEVADELERVMKSHQGEHSFSPIVASGVRGALPHGRATTKKIESGELVTMDFGCLYNGYCSDMTRTVAVGKVEDKLVEIYNIVLESQMAGVNAVKKGIKGQDVDKVCRDIIDSKGYGKNFGHGTGHGLGMLVHEGPSVGSKSEDILSPGNVITVEPGIYIDGFGGVRIEDDVVVKEDGIEVLTKSPKELIIL